MIHEIHRLPSPPMVIVPAVAEVTLVPPVGSGSPADPRAGTGKCGEDVMRPSDGKN